MGIETVQKYSVEIQFGESFKKLQTIQQKLTKFNNMQEASLKKQISLRRQLEGIKRSTAQGGLGGEGRGSSRRSSGIDPVAQARKEAAALERAKESLKNSAFWRRKEANAAHETARASIRDGMAKVRTVKQLRRLVAEEKSKLELVTRQSREYRKQNFLLQKMNTSSKQFLGNWVSFFAVAAGAGVITRIGQDFEAVRNTMKAVSTDTKESGENFQFIKEEALRLGIGLKESAKGFAKMLAARGDMSLEDTKALFSATAEMGTLLGLTSVEAGRATNAIQQMMSKGVVSAKTLAL